MYNIYIICVATNRYSFPFLKISHFYQQFSTNGKNHMSILEKYY